MSTIVTRAAKGSPLTHNEVDANFTNLNTDKLQTVTLTGDVTGSGGASFSTTIANDAVGNDKLANMAFGTIKARTTAGSGNPENATGTEVTALLDTFTSGLKGLVPASGGGTTNFLRADGTFAAPTAAPSDPTVVSDTSTGTVNDWSPSGMGSTGPVIIDWTGAASVLINGLANGASGRQVTIHNGGVHLMVLKLEGSPATAANRFERASADRDPIILLPNDQMTLEYMSSLSRWSVVSNPQGGPRTRWRLVQIGPSSGTGFSSINITGSSNGGTVSHVVPAATNQKTSKYRQAYATSATAGTQAGGRTSTTIFWRGNATDVGGVFAVFSWGWELLPASAESWFVGLQGSTATLGNIDASAALNTVGWGRDPADSAQIREMNNDGSGAATKVDLGSSFPESLTTEYGGAIWAAPNGAGFSTVIWRKDDLTVAPIITDRTTDIPANTVFLQGIAWICNRAAAADYRLSSTQLLRAWTN